MMIGFLLSFGVGLMIWGAFALHPGLGLATLGLFFIAVAWAHNQ